jgi:LemA protein
MQENELQNGIKSIFAVAENYPDLKASANFLELQTQWSELEDRLQGARRAYNAAVKVLMNKKEMFPSNIIAKMMTIPEFTMFEADDSAKVEKIDAKELFAK